MTYNEASIYIQSRLDDIENLYRKDFPKWNNNDLVAVQILVRELITLKSKSD